MRPYCSPVRRSGFGAGQESCASGTETEPQTIKAFNNIARRFEAKNPGIKIEAEGSRGPTWRARLWRRSPPDRHLELSHGQPITCTAMQSKGLLNPLDEVVKAIGDGNIWEQVKRVCNVGGKQFGLVHALRGRRF